MSISGTTSELIWIGFQKDGPSEYTAQRFSGAGSPVQVIGNNFDSNGRYYNLAISGTTLYSGNSGSIYQWDATDGSYIGQLTLDQSATSEMGGSLSGIGTSTGGDLLLAPSGFSTNTRSIARYTTGGNHIRTYTHANLQHPQGTPAGNDDALIRWVTVQPGKRVDRRRIDVQRQHGDVCGNHRRYR